MEILALSIMTAAGALLVIFRAVPMRFIVRFGVGIDIVTTALLVTFFHGTFSGIIVGTAAGLIVSLVLTLIRAGHTLPGRIRQHIAGIQF
jgi:membrane protease YdiL (CAAX protease family)